MKTLRRWLFWSTIAVGAIAVLGELRRPAEQRQWHGYVLGFVPYDFRAPSFSRLRDAWWNPDDPRLLTPRDFGVGWAVNLHRAYVLVTGHRSLPPPQAGAAPETA